MMRFGVVPKWVVAATLAAGVALLGAVGHSDASAPCVRDSGSALSSAGGRLLTINDAGGLEVLAAGRASRKVALSPAPTGVLRHAQSRGDLSVVVNDVRGADEVLVVSSTGHRRLRGGTDIFHPTIGYGSIVAWVADGDRVVLTDLSTDHQRIIHKPPHLASVHSTTFWDGLGLVVAGQEAVVGEPIEFESLSNLWLIDLDGDEWTRLTDFEVSGGETRVVRAPTVDADGSLRFSVVRSSAEDQDTLVLTHWTLESPASDPVPVAPDVAGWAFPAGLDGSTLLWNSWDEQAGKWRIGAAADGSTAGRVCGHTRVDDSGQLDLDLIPEAPMHVDTSDSEPTGAGSRSVLESRSAVVVGDFESVAAAELVMLRLRTRFDVFTISHQDAPYAVAPGAWAVAWVVEPEDDPSAALETLRAAFPDLEEMSWVSSL